MTSKLLGQSPFHTFRPSKTLKCIMSWGMNPRYPIQPFDGNALQKLVECQNTNIKTNPDVSRYEAPENVPFYIEFLQITWTEHLGKCSYH